MSYAVRNDNQGWRSVSSEADVVAGEYFSEAVPEAPLPQVRASAWAAIKAKRDTLKGGGVHVGGKWYHSDDSSRIQHLGLVMMGAGIPQNLQWKTLDGSFVTMTPALAQQIFVAVAASDVAIFTVAEHHRVAMEANADPSTYDYSAGWPATFESGL